MQEPETVGISFTKMTVTLKMTFTFFGIPNINP